MIRHHHSKHIFEFQSMITNVNILQNKIEKKTRTPLHFLHNIFPYVGKVRFMLTNESFKT